MTTSTTIFEAGDIVRAPFPHVERKVIVVRPALVITVRPVGLDAMLLWMLMITNALRAPWPGDVPIPDAAEAGLIAPSVVRTAKIVAAEAASASRIGHVDPDTRALILDRVRAYLGL